MKITQILTGIPDNIKISFKEKRIFKALEIAKLNASEQLTIAEAELKTFDASNLEAEEVISKISDLLERVEDAKYTIEHLNKVENYLKQDD